jgi:OOP family OmpA-OmpF porin
MEWRKKMRLRSALLAATVLAVPFAAKAQPITGIYVSGAVGANLLQDETLNFSGLGGGPSNSRADFNNPGLLGLASVGYGLGNGLRLEVEGQYSYNALHGVVANNSGRSGGRQDGYGAFANALYDFNVGLPFMYPYIGAGLGNEWSQLDNVHFGNATTTTHMNGVTNNFAYQGIAGISWPIHAIPGFAITTEYRLVGVLDPQPSMAATQTSGGVTTHGQMNIGNEFNHELLLGVRYAFGSAPPPPPPAPAPAPVAAPAPAPARTYLVFFDWDRADLTDRARQIIAEAAQASTHVSYTRIEVNGYTDLSGTPAYNQKLSVKRAQTVAAELVRDGVPQNAIDVQGFGESHPLVPTAKGVREPQNRRVEIILK